MKLINEMRIQNKIRLRNWMHHTVYFGCKCTKHYGSYRSGIRDYHNIKTIYVTKHLNFVFVPACLVCEFRDLIICIITWKCSYLNSRRLRLINSQASVNIRGRFSEGGIVDQILQKQIDKKTTRAGFDFRVI